MIHLHSGLFSNYATCIEDTDFQIHNKATVTVYSYFFSAIYPAASPLLENMLFPQWGEIFSPHYPSVREKLPSGSQPAANRIINSHSAAKLALGQPEMVMLTHKKKPWRHSNHDVAFRLGFDISWKWLNSWSKFRSVKKPETIGGDTNSILNMNNIQGSS